MAKSTPVWAIDIGNTSLKALQCRVGSDPGTIEALAFDYIEHSKILSQPGAEIAEIIAESLTTFVSRNDVFKSKVAISVSGQNTISRFLKLPPVDRKKLPDIIQLEAKQWLPFALEDVVWDYQPLVGGSMQGNTLVDSEIGMFAMKREFAARALFPFEKAGIPIDCIQSAPLALYNFAAYDQFDLTQIQGGDGGQSFNNYTVVLCLGTDSSDVVITNGVKIWVRNITIGGNNFTKAITKGMKLMFSNAEHLKRNVAASQDPKAVFQVMRPVFNELLTEVNRSVEFYSSLDRKAKFTKILALGSPTKLPGLLQFLRQNLGYEVVRLPRFQKLVGDDVIANSTFMENVSTFGICYGLTLQMLNESAIGTNLIPTEVVTQRLINNKKPWLLAGAAALMLGFIVPFMSVTSAYAPLQNSAMKSAENQANSAASTSKNFIDQETQATSEFDEVDKVGATLTGNIEGRIRWPEFFYVLNKALPQNNPNRENPDLPLEWQDRIYITNIDVQKVEDLGAEWWEIVKTLPAGAYIIDPLEEPAGEGGAASSAASDDSATDSSASSMASNTASSGEGGVSGDKTSTGVERAVAPEGAGYIVQMPIYHFHNPDPRIEQEKSKNDPKYEAREVNFWDTGAEYVRQTLFKNLRYNEVELPSSLSEQSFSTNAPVKVEAVTMKEFGFSHPVLLKYNVPEEKTIVDPSVLQKEIQKAILQQRTKFLKTQGQTGGRGGYGSGRGGAVGGNGMNMGYADDALSTTLGVGGTSGYGGGVNPLIALAQNNSGGGASGNIMGGGGGAQSVVNTLKTLPPDQRLDVRRFDAVIQFVWIPKTPTERAEARKKAEEEKAAATASEMTEEAPIEEPETTSINPSAETITPTEMVTEISNDATEGTTAPASEISENQ
ncbi:MAG: pilus assembly protein PilM [Planctomycetaceae bacterium]|jgi:type IV pilus assembly protein PilM|nr:pilus assembly protein PilM [Planctomycetaceae bacterium]